MKRISNSEQVIMDLLWREHPLTAAQIVRRCAQDHQWSDKTIKTFISRLQEKGAIYAEKRDVLYYSPVFTREEAGRGQAKAILESMFEGSFSRMTAQFINSGDLSDEDIRELREYLAGFDGISRGKAEKDDDSF